MKKRVKKRGSKERAFFGRKGVRIVIGFVSGMLDWQVKYACFTELFDIFASPWKFTLSLPPNKK